MPAMPPAPAIPPAPALPPPLEELLDDPVTMSSSILLRSTVAINSQPVVRGNVAQAKARRDAIRRCFIRRCREPIMNPINRPNCRRENHADT